MLPELILYTRQGCHLCEAFLQEMDQFDASLKEKITIVDVDDAPEHSQQFGDKVPIFFANGDEICRYYFDAVKMISCLKLQGYSIE